MAAKYFASCDRVTHSVSMLKFKIQNIDISFYAFCIVYTCKTKSSKQDSNKLAVTTSECRCRRGHGSGLEQE